MNNKNVERMVFLLILIVLCCCNCNCQEPTYEQQSNPTKSTTVTGARKKPKVAGMDIEMASMCDDRELLKNIHKFVAEAKCAGVLDEELIRVLIAYSILNKIPVEEVKNFLVAAKFAGLSNEIRYLNFSNDIEGSNKTLSLSSSEKFMLILAVLFIVGACSTYIYKEYQSYREREELKARFQYAFQSMGENIESARNKIKRGFDYAWNRVSSWWNGQSAYQYAQPAYQ